jgi:hypothetical protein
MGLAGRLFDGRLGKDCRVLLSFASVVDNTTAHQTFLTRQMLALDSNPLSTARAGPFTEVFRTGSVDYLYRHLH